MLLNKITSLFYFNDKFSKYLNDIYSQGKGNIIAQIIGVLSIPIFTRLFTPEEYGALSLFTNVVAFLSIIITFRIEYLVILDKSDLVANSLVSLILRYGVSVTILYTLLFFAFNSFIISTLNLNTISDYIYFCPLAALLVSLSVAVQQLQQRNQNYSISGISEVVNKCSVVIFTLLGFYFSRSTFALIFSNTFGILSKILFLSNKERLIKKNWYNFRKKISFLSFLKYCKTSFSFSFSNVMLTFTGYLPVFYISKYYGIEVLGNWSLMIMALYLPTSVIGNAIGQVFYERAAKLHAEGLPFMQLWISTVKILLLISLPCFSLFSFLSPYIFTIVFGEKWNLAGQYGSVFSIVAGLSFIVTPLDKACYIINQWKYPYIYNSLRLIAVLFVLYFCQKNNSSFDVFLYWHVFQSSLLYIFDFIMGFYFSKKELH
jgi:teichuronic acid exporter